MTQLVIRQLLIDLETPFPVRWMGGDAFKSALFNALSMSFPAGEQYFIDSVRQGAKLLPPEDQERMATEIKGFIGQEATHRRLHHLFNQNLLAQGLQNQFERRALARIAANAHRDTRMHVGATAATEHFTAIFANWLMLHPEALAGTDPRLVSLWMWHAAEESEHRSTAFDLYQRIGGNHTWRIRMFNYVTMTFLTDIVRQTVRNLWQDKALFKWSTWRSAWHFLFSKQGMIRGNYSAWKDYFKPDFHPNQHDATLSQQWLSTHQDQFRAVGQAA